MAVATEAPIGGVARQVGGKTRPLLLTNGEIERFENQHDLGIFTLLYQCIENTVQARHARDIVALGLVGAGLSDTDADRFVASEPPHRNFALREVARDLLLATFSDPNKKKDEPEVGSSSVSVQVGSTQSPASDKPSKRRSSQTSGAK